MKSRFANPSLLLAVLLIAGCSHKVEYGVEHPLSLPGPKQQIWAVAPAINLSGQTQVDPILQADLLFQQLQQVNGLVAIPVNRVAEVYASLRIERVQSEEQAALVCDLLGCDALIVPTVTAYDPYNPPKFGAALQVFTKPDSYQRPTNIDPRQLSRQAAPTDVAVPVAAQGSFVQAVGMYDAANGSVRQALDAYAAGRNDPAGPYGAKEYLVSMDRYCGFAYHLLVADLLNSPQLAKR